jgi:hypothetical protein
VNRVDWTQDVTVDLSQLIEASKSGLSCGIRDYLKQQEGLVGQGIYIGKLWAKCSHHKHTKKPVEFDFGEDLITLFRKEK